MKKHYFFFFLFLLSFESYSQELLMETELVSAPDSNEPKFNGGGMEKFNEFVNKEFDFTKVKKAGKMVAAFTIDTEGNLKNIKLVEFIDIESATEMFRVLNKCPKWQPANRAGKIISVEVKYPMVFRERKKNNTESSSPSSNNENLTDNSSPNNDDTKSPKKGGIEKFYKFISENYQMPEVEGISGKVIVSFVIDVDGSVVDIKVLKDIGYGTAEEAIRVLKKCPKWTPAMKDGKPVRTELKLPINIYSK